MRASVAERILEFIAARQNAHLQDITDHFGVKGPDAGKIELIALDLLQRGCLEEPGQFNRFSIGEAGRRELRKLKAAREAPKQTLLFT